MAKLKKRHVIERWSTLFIGMQGRGKEIFRRTGDTLKELNTPRVNLVEREVAPTFIKKLQGKQRTFLIASNDYLKGYKMYLGAMDYGEQLFLSWYLTEKPRILERMVQFMRLHWLLAYLLFFFYLPLRLLQRIMEKTASPSTMDLFDLEELTAYITSVHHAFLEAIEVVAQNLKLDFTKVDTKSSGFFNIT